MESQCKQASACSPERMREQSTKRTGQEVEEVLFLQEKKILKENTILRK